MSKADNCYTHIMFTLVFLFIRLSQERTILLKQQLSIMDKWLNKTERKMKKDEQIGHNYETTKKQLDEHQVINDKL